ncbi:c-type cytochrome [Sulfurimonas sp. HSL3-2]|uniref:c-type cytochrome n=1 Tax=Hydrocurvibacter mobilis TaxID=3131936 RepID=UPI0031F79CAC
MNWKLPFDIPLVTPTMGIPIEFYDALGIIVFVIHISFIYVLIGASTASVIYNVMGVFKKDKNYDKLAYNMTNPTTISENMGALWGVAPLLVISVLYTGFFYTAILKVSPHILHIIYGNIFAFLLSYAYKFSWHKLSDSKGFHIAIGLVAVLVFYSLPPVFMSMANLYLQPETFATVQNIWDIMLTPLTGFRLLNFFLTAFGFTGIFMIWYGMRMQKNGEEEVGKIAVNQGKKWFMFSTPVNVAILPLLLFAFSPRIAEGLMGTVFIYLPFFASIVLTIIFFYLMRRWKKDTFSSKEVFTVALMMVFSVVLMATARHGIRVVSFKEPLAIQAAATKAYMTASLSEYKKYKESMKNVVKKDLSNPATLAESKGCLACHSIDTTLVGPAYKEVAAKYSSAQQIVNSIKNGSEGKWGTIAMPAQDVDDKEANILADWVLSQKQN